LKIATEPEGKKWYIRFVLSPPYSKQRLQDRSAPRREIVKLGHLLPQGVSVGLDLIKFPFPEKPFNQLQVVLEFHSQQVTLSHVAGNDI